MGSDNKENYIDDHLSAEALPHESLEVRVAEVALWCKVIERFYEDILAIMQRCDYGVSRGMYDGMQLWFFVERRKYLQYLECKDFELICDSANMDHMKLYFKFKQLLQIKA